MGSVEDRDTGDDAADDDTSTTTSDAEDAFLRAVAHVEGRLPEEDAEESEPPMPQRVGRFEIRSTLGRGGMGIVYEARDAKLDRIVALKVLPPAFEQDVERRKRLLAEARSAALVAHPHVAVVHDVGVDEERVYIAMELIRGESLRRAIEGGPMPIERALEIARQIANALAHAHGMGVVHRDLKPDNVMLRKDNEGGDDVKVLDFGLAKRVDVRAESGTAATVAAASAIATTGGATTVGRLVGTPGYMSPEQALGKATDAGTDVFAFGVVLYEMLTGVRPFRGDSSMEVIVAITRDEPTPPSRHRREISASLERFVLRCLAKSPRERFADGAALEKGLANVDLVGRSKTMMTRVLLSSIAVALAMGIWVVVRGESSATIVSTGENASFSLPSLPVPSPSPSPSPSRSPLSTPEPTASAPAATTAAQTPSRGPSAAPSTSSPLRVMTTTTATATSTASAPRPSRDPLGDQK